MSLYTQNGLGSLYAIFIKTSKNSPKNPTKAAFVANIASPERQRINIRYLNESISVMLSIMFAIFNFTGNSYCVLMFQQGYYKLLIIGFSTFKENKSLRNNSTGIIVNPIMQRKKILSPSSPLYFSGCISSPYTSFICLLASIITSSF